MSPQTSYGPEGREFESLRAYRTDEGKCVYVCAILDLFSRKVVAHRVSPKNSTYLTTSTFRQAFQRRNAPQSLMFHSDQGAQYTSKTFRRLLRMNKVVQSFSKSGQPHDNAVMESFFASMKREEIYRTQYKSEQQFIKSVDMFRYEIGWTASNRNRVNTTVDRHKRSQKI